jgi:hypothetical protein
MAATNFLGAVAVAQESGYLVRRYLAEDVTKDLDSLLDGCPVAERPAKAGDDDPRLYRRARKSSVRSSRWTRDPRMWPLISIAPAAFGRRGYFSLLLRVAVHGTMIARRMARRNDVAQSIVCAL